MTKFRLLLLVSFFLQGCAILHHAQIGNIDNSKVYRKRPFDLKVSETGLSLHDTQAIGRAALSKKDGKNFEDAMNVIKLFQMGPSTGNPVFTEGYAKNMVRKIYEQCPDGRVTGLTLVRETNRYPVISGEIVRITGFCLVPKEG